MAPPRATVSSDSSPKSAKRHVSGVISPEYSQSPTVSLKIFSKSATICSPVTSAMLCLSTQGARDDKISVTGGIDGHRHPRQFREFTGKSLSKGHFDFPTCVSQRLDDHALRAMCKATAQRLTDGLFGAPEPRQPLLPGWIPDAVQQASLLRSEGYSLEIRASRLNLLNVDPKPLMRGASPGDGEGRLAAMRER